MYLDRADAGRQLAQAIKEQTMEWDLVLGIPRGGLPVARIVADTLECSIDVIVAKKIGAPGNPELALGAVTADGVTWWNDSLLEHVGIEKETLDDERSTAIRAAREVAAQFQAGRSPIDPTDQAVLLVDDGIATGATVRAAIRSLKQADVQTLGLAIPVGPPDTIASLTPLVDLIVCPLQPPQFQAVGVHYRTFDQVSTAEAVTYLEST